MTFRTLLVLTTALAAAPLAAQQFERGERNADFEPAFDAQFRAPITASGVDLAVASVAEGLEHPWGIAVLPDERGYLVTERPGRLRHVAPDGTLSDPISGVPEVWAERQGGLLDVALAPDFTDSRRIYMTYAKPGSDGTSATAAAYATLSEDLTTLQGLTDIFVQEPFVPASMHYGARVAFDGAGHVFVTTGEHFTQDYRDLAQDNANTFGVVARVTMDGAVPDDNPFVGDPDAVDTIWSYGHRNIQGAFYADGALWTIEHGPKGGDELNRPEAGKNYGWPVISYGVTYEGDPIGSGDAQMEGMEQPVYFWDPVIAPAGMVRYEGEMYPLWQGDIFISSLHPGGIVRLGLEDGEVAEEERLMMDLGRIRDLAVDTDGSFLAITDYADGQIVRLSAQKLPEDS